MPQVKCIKDPPRASSCKRCTRLHLPCAYDDSRRRGPKPGEGQQSHAARRVSVPAVGVQAASGSGGLNVAQVNANRAGMTTRRIEPILGILSTPTGPHLDTPSSTDVDVTHYLDPEAHHELDHQHASSARPSPVTECDAAYFDPILWRYLSVMEAEHLIELFHKHLNPMIALLDLHLHTLPYLRHTSPALLTAVLAAASRFFRKDLAQTLLDHSQTIINRELGLGTCDIGLIQALMTLVYWKAPGDRSAWLKIGIAIRLAYQLQCNSAVCKPLPTANTAARQVLVRLSSFRR